MRCLLLISFLWIGCREHPVELVAAHDSPTTAFPLSANQRVKGKLQPGNNTVYFSLKLEEQAMLRAELSAVRGADTQLQILDTRGDVLITANDHGSSLAEEIYPVFLAAGNYLLLLSASAEAVAEFTLFYRLFRPPPDIEREANNTPETATLVAATHASGFYGGEFFINGKEKSPEQDCFRFHIQAEGKSRASFTLTGVDGYTAILRVLNRAGDVLAAAKSEKPGALLSVGPVAIPEDRQLTACVRATRRELNASRDYYDLDMRLSDVEISSESEPNNSLKTAGQIAAETMEGNLAAINDVDYFYWQNRREYPVILRVELASRAVQLLQLEAGSGQVLRSFAGSAKESEVADNLRVEPGERIILVVRCSSKCNRKTFKPVSYRLRLDESQATDENESEPNDSPEQAEVLVDLTQKWGFINPFGDMDYYRLSLSQNAVRDVIVESKLNCRLRLEHLRGGKVLAVSAGKGKVIYNAELAQGDLLRLQCTGNSSAAAERSYRLSLNEP
jgi:hypothetical protein